MPNLVGIGNSQVPTNAMLGGLAYQDPAHANLTSVEIENIAAIKATISPTDQFGSTGTTKKSVFVYDTRNDSDGGAWRKRTQHCTWYNEELGTQWRGNRREFPSVAILVTHEGGSFFGFTIYDGDDPNCPMWLNWHFCSYTPTSNWGSGIPQIGRANFVGYTPGAISALNGQIAMANYGAAGSTATWQPGWMINMISEKCLDVVSYGSASDQTYWVSSDISARVKWAAHSGAAPNNYVQGNRYGSNDSVLSEGKSGITGKPTKGNVNSISMTVEPGAMTDKFTGLPTPTQAWGRDDGISVMRGTNNTWVNDGWGNYDVHATDFSSIHDLVAVNRSGNVVGTVLWDNKDGYAAEETGNGSYYHYNLSMALNPSLGVVYTGNEDVRFMPSPYGGPDDLAVIPSSNRGLNLYMGGGIDHSSASSCSRICARITKDYNTGWMMGDCTIALLMDTVATDITQDIHVDEGFDATGSWSLGDNASISGGNLVLDNTTNSRATHNTFLAANTSYMCRYHVSNSVNNWQFDDDGSGAGLGGITAYGTIDHGDDGTFTFVFKTTASTRLRIIRTASSNSNNITISYIRFYKIQKGDNTSADDRNITYGGGSVYGGATVGKLVRNSVSTQANSTHPTKGNSELVGYSSWGNGSGGTPTTGHLVVGYSGKFDIGTNDFLFMGWVFPPAGQSSSHPILCVGDSDHNDGFLIEVSGGTGWFLDIGYLGVNNSFASSNGGTAVHAALQGDQWNMWAVYKQGSNFRLYTNGEYCGNDFGSSGQNWTTKWKAQHMMIGGRSGNLGGATNNWAHPSMRQAMIRFGETYSSWSDEDFRKVYEDERKLFGHDVQCTLYGAQTDVSSMDYDKSTGLLHVGTSASGGGRSDFRRLVRINNTTDPINKVSASGGLIAEY